MVMANIIPRPMTRGNFFIVVLLKIITAVLVPEILGIISEETLDQESNLIDVLTFLSWCADSQPLFQLVRLEWTPAPRFLDLPLPMLAISKDCWRSRARDRDPIQIRLRHIGDIRADQLLNRAAHWLRPCLHLRPVASRPGSC